MDLVALLPWWAGVGLAFLSYWLLHAIATRPIAAAKTAQQIGQLASTALLQGLATGGQYVLPLIFIVGAFLSFLRRQQRLSLFEATSTRGSTDALLNMTWQQFELLVGEGFRRRGYTVREIGGGGADGGVDLILTRAGEKTFVQCKQWRAFKVGVSTVRKLYGVMAAHGAAGGIVVTSGHFTNDALSFANGRNIQLVDGPALMKLLREARPKGAQTTPPSSAPASPNVVSIDQRRMAAHSVPRIEPMGSTEPTCPKCGKPMVRRVAKRGAHAGKAFWGCTAFSDGCQGTRNIQRLQ